MSRSIIASYIDEEYKRQQYYQKKAEREKCKDKECIDCKYQEICTSYEDNYKNINKEDLMC